MPDFPGAMWIPPVLGTVIFVYGGQPFLTGGWAELRVAQTGDDAADRAWPSASRSSPPGSPRSGIGGFDLDFWWELALLIVIMLLGHWLEMRALGSASGALDALAALLPDTAEKITGDGDRRGAAVASWRAATWCWSVPGAGARRRHRHRRRAPSSTNR